MELTLDKKDLRDLYGRGMTLLRDGLGTVEAETFIAMLRNDQYDYTEWRREAYKNMTVKEILEGAETYAKIRPYRGDPSTIV